MAVSFDPGTPLFQFAALLKLPLLTVFQDVVMASAGEALVTNAYMPQASATKGLRRFEHIGARLLLIEGFGLRRLGAQPTIAGKYTPATRNSYANQTTRFVDAT